MESELTISQVQKSMEMTSALNEVSLVLTPVCVWLAQMGQENTLMNILTEFETNI
ncbi:MAG: hypothetical protein ACLRZ6_08190 [Lachnospiraceae bacterium]